jgi:hypothetical protein
MDIDNPSPNEQAKESIERESLKIVKNSFAPTIFTKFPEQIVIQGRKYKSNSSSKSYDSMPINPTTVTMANIENLKQMGGSFSNYFRMSHARRLPNTEKSLFISIDYIRRSDFHDKAEFLNLLNKIIILNPKDRLNNSIYEEQIPLQIEPILEYAIMILNYPQIENTAFQTESNKKSLIDFELILPLRLDIYTDLITQLTRIANLYDLDFTTVMWEFTANIIGTENIQFMNDSIATQSSKSGQPKFIFDIPSKLEFFSSLADSSV